MVNPLAEKAKLLTKQLAEVQAKRARWSSFPPHLMIAQHELNAEQRIQAELEQVYRELGKQVVEGKYV